MFTVRYVCVSDRICSLLPEVTTYDRPYGAIEIRLLLLLLLLLLPISIGLAVLCSVFTQKQVFGPRTAKSQPYWIEFCTQLLLYGIRCGPK